MAQPSRGVRVLSSKSLLLKPHALLPGKRLRKPPPLELFFFFFFSLFFRTLKEERRLDKLLSGCRRRNTYHTPPLFSCSRNMYGNPLGASLLLGKLLWKTGTSLRHQGSIRMSPLGMMFPVWYFWVMCGGDQTKDLKPKTIFS